MMRFKMPFVPIKLLAMVSMLCAPAIVVPADLKSTVPICQGFNQYQDTCNLAKSFKEMKKRGRIISKKLHMKFDPLAIKQAVAMRFINRSDWMKLNEKGVFEPSLAYEPAPTTWTQWQKVAFDLVQKAAELQTPLTAEHIK